MTKKVNRSQTLTQRNLNSFKKSGVDTSFSRLKNFDYFIHWDLYVCVKLTIWQPLTIL